MYIEYVKRFCWIFSALFLLFAAPAFALEGDQTDDIKNLEGQLSAFEKQYKNNNLSEKDLHQFIKSLDEFTGKIQVTITSIETNAAKLAQQIESLGEALADEPQEVKKKRETLRNEKLQNEKWLAHDRVLLLQGDEVLSVAKKRLNDLLAKRLLHKSHSIWSLASYTLEHPGEMVKYFSDYMAEHHGLNAITTAEYLTLALFLPAALILGLWLRSRMLAWSFTTYWGNQFISRFFQTFAISTARYLPYLMLSSMAAILLYSLLANSETLSLIELLGYLSPAFVLGLYFIGLIFYPGNPARSILHIPEKVGRRMSHKFAILAMLAFCGFIIVNILRLQEAPQQVIIFWRDVVVLLVVINLIWIVVYTRNVPQISHKSMPRLAIVLVLLALLVLELLGYRNLVFTIASIGVAALAGFAVVIIAHRLSKDFYDGLDGGTRQWHQNIRSHLGLASNQAFPGLTFARLVTFFALWGGFLMFAVSLLDFSGNIRQTVSEWLVHGINIGNLNFNPSKILLAIIVFAMLYTLSSWIKTQLERQWLSKSRIERGAKDTLVIISGYIGVAIALIIALSVAGVTFTNFAIIAGALSVGIGFGLQNIVNNFVSGLILLFERPIKNGDWIIVGSTEGYVKKISIRSTQIQTFDRADIIVPNSELVSTQVTNWMLHDRIGRIRIPVGVAYGSDTDLVRQTLHDVAEGHPLVIKNSNSHPINIFFLRFGESSLDFELRCFIEDIDGALRVKSDLHYAIDKAFRENRIQIPFPQRDIHIKGTAYNNYVDTGNQEK